MDTRTDLQWGGRFDGKADDRLLAFGSSLADDLALAPFDVRCSQAHVIALERGGVIAAPAAAALTDALQQVRVEIAHGSFAAYAQAGAFEDVHGAIDARVRELAGEGAGANLHAGRSRNDQVATTLKLYVADRARAAAHMSCTIANGLLGRAREELHAQTIVAATTHWQPAQPILLAFWLEAAAEPFIRAAARFSAVISNAMYECPLGSSALAGSSLPLDRGAASSLLGFSRLSRNALDAVGDRDAGIDLLHALARALAWASRVSEELVIWCTPAYGYARLGDAASTGSSAMPQKRNPDPFELVRAAASGAHGALMAALGTQTGIALSYHRDLQETKGHIIRGSERSLAALAAFGAALEHVAFNRVVMATRAGDGFTVATDIAEALVARGVTARDAHRLVGARVLQAEREGRALDASDILALETQTGLSGLALDAPLTAIASVCAKKTKGSTHPDSVRSAIAAAQAEVGRIQEGFA